MNLSNGTRLGPYEIIAPLGAGGMGEVYCARDTKLNREVAVKVLLAAFAGDAERMARFQREAQVLASLNHPNIAAIYGLEESGGVRGLVMELVEGPTLADRIQQGAVGLDEALGIARQIAEALEAAHEKGIIHRDLKPANIKIKPDGMVKVLDFGLAKLADPVVVAQGVTDASTMLTLPEASRLGVIMGTVAYMSPEQASGKPVDKRSDVWSFGVVLWEMLSGRRLFEGETVSHSLAAVLTKAPDWKHLPAGTPASVHRLLRRCLERDRKRRLPDMGSARLEIEEAIGGAAGAETEQGPLQTAGLRHKLPWAVAGALALVVAAIALWAPWRGVQPPAGYPAVRLDVDLGPDVSLGSGTGPAVILSPDGTRLVFVSQRQDGTRGLFTRRLDQPKATPLAKTEGAYAPFFSPDGQWVGFFAQGKLKKTRLDGGEPTSLCDAPAGRGASWGEDGNIIAALDPQQGLTQVPSEGGRSISITELTPGEGTHRWPQILPGGKAAVFIVNPVSINFDEATIAVVSLKDHRRKTLIEHAGMYPRYVPSGYLVYVTKGALFAAPFDLDRLEVRGVATWLDEVSSNLARGYAQIDFSRSGTLAYRTGGTEGLSTLQWLDGAGKTESLGAEPASYSYPRLSPDGSRLAFVVSQGSSSDLWIYELQRGSKTRLTNGIVAGYPVWSPDGRFVVFQSVGGMFWTRADGAGKPQPLTQSKALQLSNSFTPDGARLAYSEVTPGGGAETRTVPVESGSGQMRAGEPQVFLKMPTVFSFAAFSPDGRWLAYVDAESGGYEVYVRAFPDNGAKVPISNGSGTMPVWSRNGHELFYRFEDNRIMVANYTVKGESFVADKPRVWCQKELANLGLAFNFDLAPDGKRFIVLMPAESPEPRETQSHVTLVVNFFDEIRRRVAGEGK